jgi:hypothetical protein
MLNNQPIFGFVLQSRIFAGAESLEIDGRSNLRVHHDLRSTCTSEGIGTSPAAGRNGAIVCAAEGV